MSDIQQIVISLAKTYDKDGERTLGIITKPDTLKHGSDMEKQFIELAENKDVHFQLGMTYSSKFDIN